MGPAEPAPGRDTHADARTLAELRQPGGRPVLIKGATILSQDPAVGDYAAGDILIRDGKIAQVGEDLGRQAGEAVVIDAAGTIAVPGFADAHVHGWEGQLRGAAPTLDFGGYLGFTAFGYGPLYPSAGLWGFGRREGLWMSNEMGARARTPPSAWAQDCLPSTRRARPASCPGYPATTRSATR